MGRCEPTRAVASLTVVAALVSGCAAEPTAAKVAVDGIASWLWRCEQDTAAGIGWFAAPPAATAAATADPGMTLTVEAVAVATGGADRSPTLDLSTPSEPPPPETPGDLYSGTPGVALFFAEYAARAGDDAFRLFSGLTIRHALDELTAHVHEAEQADRDAGIDCGLYTGLAGIGATALEIARLCDAHGARELARRCADELQRRAQVAGHGVEWSDTTDVIGGGAGIGLYLLAYHEATGDRGALELATRAGRRLEQLAVREPVGRSWRMEPDFPRVMPNFSHGTAGIAFFLARLAEAGGEVRFLDAAREGADHLLAIADHSGGGLRVHHHTPGGEELHYLGWCHGPPGTARLFAQLAQQTGEARYGDAARAATRTLLDAGLPAQSPGFWNNVGQCCGSAGVIEHLLDVAARGDDRALADDCLALARRLGDDLLARGTWSGDALAFVHAEYRLRPDEVAAKCGYMQGAAGIGLALMHLEAAESARAAGRRLGPEARAVRLPDALPWRAAGGR